MSKVKRKMRYHNSEDDVIKISFDKGKTKKNAIIINESHTGVACVYVGDLIAVGDSVTWVESDNILTDCKTVRCEEMKEKVVFLAFEILC